VGKIGLGWEEGGKGTYTPTIFAYIAPRDIMGCMYGAPGAPGGGG
jgi:hypothetical protein